MTLGAQTVGGSGGNGTIPPLPASLGGPAPSTLASSGYDPNGISAGLATTTFTLSGGNDQAAVMGNGPAAANGGFSPPVTYNVQDWLTSFGQMDADHLKVWQNKLEASGLLKAGAYTRGYADDATMAAIQQAIVESIRQNTGLMQVLDKRVVAQGGTSTSKPLTQNTATNVINLTNPDAINKAADDAAVKELGRKATDKEKAVILAAVHGLETSQQTNVFNANVAANRNDMAANANAPAGIPTTGAGASDLDKFMAALGGQESGNPNATNPDSGAHGMYQIMPGNWAQWAVDAGLPANAPQTQANQEIVARNKVEQYYKEFGNWGDVAKAWYGGEGAPHFSAAKQNAPQGKDPSIAAYASSVLSKMGAGYGAPTTGASPSIVAATPTQTVEQIASAPADTADAQIRAMNPVEAGAHDVSNVFGNFMSIINKAGMG